MNLFNIDQSTLALKLLWILISFLFDSETNYNWADLLALTLNNISCVYKKQGDLKESLKCINMALKLTSKGNA